MASPAWPASGSTSISGKVANASTSSHLANSSGVALAIGGSAAMKSRKHLPSVALKTSKRARRVGGLALVGDELVAVAALFDRIGGGDRRQGIVEIFCLVERVGDVRHGKIDVVRRQVVADRIEEAIDIGVDEFLGLGKVGGDAALLRLGVELIGRRRPIDVPVHALGDADDEQRRAAETCRRRQRG